MDLTLKGRHDNLPSVVHEDKENPGKTKKKGQAAKDKEGAGRAVFPAVVGPINPEKLGEDNQRYRAVARMK
jgi:hypothetical protein